MNWLLSKFLIILGKKEKNILEGFLGNRNRDIAFRMDTV